MISNEEIEKIKIDTILAPLNSAEELKEWIYLYLDMDMPMGHVYPESNSSPVEAMWEIYNLIKTGKSADIPQVTMLSSRDSFKTLSAAIIEVLTMIHFKISICHLSSILSQSEKAISYVNTFFKKIKFYLEKNGWQKVSDNKRKIEWITPDNENIYLKLLVATMQGTNCLDRNTIVTTKNGDKKICEVSLEDKILTHDYRNNTRIYQSIKFVGPTIKPTIEIYFEDGSNLICSTDHQIFTNRGWITADQLKIGTLTIPKGDISIETKVCGKEIKYERNLKQVILGTLLGDASLDILPSGSVRYQVTHSPDQSEYLDEIKEIFKKNNIEFREYTHYKVFKNKKYYTKKIITKTYPIFKHISQITHKDGRKKVTKEWMDRLDIEGFAYFIMDDGMANHKTIGICKEGYLDIATCSFNEEENNLIINKLKEFNISSYLYSTTNSSKKIYPIIRIEKNDSRFFSEMLRPYFVKSLIYKLRTPLSHIRFRRFIDTAKATTLKDNSSHNGFYWSISKIEKNRKKYRDYSKKIRNQLTLKVSKIIYLGYRELFDISIDTKDEHLKSFFANNILVHNSDHTPLLVVDELDLIQNPKALDEAKMIPSTYKQYFPLTVYLSTRKFAGGLMEKTIRQTADAGGILLRWNIIDITQPISNETAKVDEPKVVRYITPELPMSNISEEDWNKLSHENKNDYERFEAYAGIAKHPMLPVMRHYLVGRPKVSKTALYKPLSAVRNNFKQLPIDMANAQLLCKKPSSSGLVYPRFDNLKNVLSVDAAIERLLGEKQVVSNFEVLRNYLLNLGITFIGGADWGYTDFTSLMVLALLPNGEIWIVDSFLENKLELDDIVKACKELNDKWKIEKWYVDQAYPAYIKTLKRNGIMCPEFTKVVVDGITAVQSRIVDSNGNRRLFVLNTPENKMIIDAFGEYKWKLDAKGDVIEGMPFHDSDGISDIMDSIRYPFQNLFNKGGKIMFTQSTGNRTEVKRSVKETADEANKSIMINKVKELAPGDKNAGENDKNKTKKRVLWY